MDQTNNNGYKDKYILDKIEEFQRDLGDIRASIKVINDHSDEATKEIIKMNGRIDTLIEAYKPTQKIVYGLVGLILTTVMVAILTLVITKQ